MATTYKTRNAEVSVAVLPDTLVASMIPSLFVNIFFFFFFYDRSIQSRLYVLRISRVIILTRATEAKSSPKYLVFSQYAFASQETLDSLYLSSLLSRV